MLNLSFPYRSPDAVRAMKTLGAKGMSLPIDGPSVFIRPMSPEEDRPEIAAQVFIDQDDLRWSIWVEPSLIDMLSDYFLSGWDEESPDSLPFAWRTLYILEALFDYIKQPLRPKHTKVRSPMAVPRDIWRASENIYLKITVNDFESCLVINHGNNVAPLMKIFEIAERIKSIDPIEIKVKSKVCIYSVPLYLYDIERLEAGDVFFISSTSQAGADATFRVPGYKASKSFLHYTGNIEWMSELPPLRIEMASMKTQNTPDFDMREDDDFSEADFFQEDTIGEDDDYSDIPVKISIEFDCGILNLSEINDMRAGSILEGVVDLHAPCVIKLSNCKMGQGRLVQVGDRIGIEITRWKQKSLYVKQED